MYRSSIRRLRLKAEFGKSVNCTGMAACILLAIIPQSVSVFCAVSYTWLFSCTFYFYQLLMCLCWMLLVPASWSMKCLNNVRYIISGLHRHAPNFSTAAHHKRDVLIEGSQKVRSLDRAWLVENEATPAVNFMKGMQVPTALSWLRRRGPQVHHGLLFQLFRNRMVKKILSCAL